ncbi:MAG: PEP-CTERM sorting domain-containing protein, partial [Akkermansia sp.]
AFRKLCISIPNAVLSQQEAGDSPRFSSVSEHLSHIKLMKISLTVLMALVGVASAAEYTTTNSTSNTANNAYYVGITLNLSGARLTTTPAFTDTTVELVSLATYIRSNGKKSGQASSFTLALTDVAGVVKALSSNAITATGYQTWSFENTTISTNEQLYFLFVDTDTENLAIGYTVTSDDLVKCGGTTLSNYADINDAMSCTFLGDNYGWAWNASTSKTFAPLVSVVTRDMLSVPEPATATLSLLALAGLAARRRR